MSGDDLEHIGFMNGDKNSIILILDDKGSSTLIKRTPLNLNLHTKRLKLESMTLEDHKLVMKADLSDVLTLREFDVLKEYVRSTQEPFIDRLRGKGIPFLTPKH